MFSQYFRWNTGLFGGPIPDNDNSGPDDSYSNWYVIPTLFTCWLDGTKHRFELPEGAIRPKVKEYGNVFGCGLVLDPDNNLSIFFTLNGKFLGELMLEVLKNMSCIFAII
jgi:hypothetical protein